MLLAGLPRFLHVGFRRVGVGLSAWVGGGDGLCVVFTGGFLLRGVGLVALVGGGDGVPAPRGVACESALELDPVGFDEARREGAGFVDALVEAGGVGRAGFEGVGLDAAGREGGRLEARARPGAGRDGEAVDSGAAG